MRRVVVVAAASFLAVACTDSDGVYDGPETLLVPVFASSAVSDHLGTHLTGAEEVPARDTRAQGQAIFRVNEDGTISFKLNVANIQNVTQAHIHNAAFGVNGGIVAWLYPAEPPFQITLIPGRSQGTLGEGVIEDAEVIGPLAGQGLAGLLAQIRAGNTYVNVHTLQFPPGEIRGQID